jgi:hypothetical protein
MRKIFFCIIVLCHSNFLSQNKQVLFGFAELPQTLLLNPGSETSYNFHVGVPLLSGFSAEFGAKGFSVSDIFAADNIAINDKIAQVFNNLTEKDYVKFNSQIEVFNAGFRYDDKTYLSFGFYEEIDAFGYFPKDIVTFFNEGNEAHLNKSFNISQVVYKFDLLGVIHAGITKKINDKLTLGGRFKIYSSALNMESSNNSGTLTTVQGVDNIYRHYLDNVNVNLKTSGLVKDDEFIDDPSTYLKNTFLGGSLGLGFDIGITYHLSPQLEFTGSILDFGYINYKKNIKNTVAEGDFTFDGVGFEYDNSSTNYWEEIDARFKEELPTDENENSYTSWRPVKINAALKYSFGERKSKICYDNSYQDYYTDAIGVQLFSVFRPLSPQLALTAFYQKAISNKIHTKITYTVDDLSSTNIGAGISAQFSKVNIYGMIDNILEYRNLSKANNLSLQLGINIIFN